MATLCAKTMDYRGLGSGIIRALKADVNIEFRNEASGDQFRAILWRTTQKSDLKNEGKEKIGHKTEILEGIGEKTTHKTEKSEETTQKTTQKIISLMAENPKISTENLAELCGMTRDGINWQIRKLKETNRIRRVGPDKGGHWEVM